MPRKQAPLYEAIRRRLSNDAITRQSSHNPNVELSPPAPTSGTPTYTTRPQPVESTFLREQRKQGLFVSEMRKRRDDTIDMIETEAHNNLGDIFVSLERKVLDYAELLKQNVVELSHALSEVRDENRHLRCQLNDAECRYNGIDVRLHDLCDEYASRKVDFDCAQYELEEYKRENAEMKRLKQELVITQAQHESQLSQLEEELERVKLTRDDVASVVPLLLTVFRCSVCLQVMTDPTPLSCGHLYCNSCITLWVMSPSTDGLANHLSCPACRTPIRRTVINKMVGFDDVLAWLSNLN